MITGGDRPGTTVEAEITAYGGGVASQRYDRLATEEPLEIRMRAGGHTRTVAITMRTPGADFELAAGFLYNEGVLASFQALREITYCVDRDVAEEQRYNIVNVDLHGRELPPLDALERHFTMTSACGVCGKANIEALRERGLTAVRSDVRADAALIADLPERVIAAQRVFATTGGLHAAALFDANGTLLTVREDVGRHNALDKLTGWALMNGKLPLDEHIVLLSGRASYELLQKAISAGIGVVCSVSAPSSLAVDLAREFGVTLAGFVRAGRFNVYAGRERIVFPVKLLLLGGYRFVGRAIIEAAQARGHAVSAFNRGNHPVLPGVEHIRGDRDDPSPLAAGRWDAVVDTSGYIPRHTREAAETLRDRIGTYAFVSSISAYAQPMIANTDETGALAQIPPETDLDAKPTGETYGALKVLCEESLEAAMPDRVLTIRPGFIVGPYDYTDRFNSWVKRAAQSGPLAVPGDPAQPVQMIDVRDLAGWMVAMIERASTGTFNATAPDRPLSLLEMAQACLDGTGNGEPPAVMPEGAEVPFRLESADYGAMEVNIDRALAAGLRFRPLRETARDTHAWLERVGN